MEATIQIQKILWPRAHSRDTKFPALKEVGTTQGHLRSFGLDLLPELTEHTDWGTALVKLPDAV